jgi:hypothetical protein
VRTAVRTKSVLGAELSHCNDHGVSELNARGIHAGIHQTAHLRNLPWRARGPFGRQENLKKPEVRSAARRVAVKTAFRNRSAGRKTPPVLENTPCNAFPGPEFRNTLRPLRYPSCRPGRQPGVNLEPAADSQVGDEFADRQSTFMATASGPPCPDAKSFH